MNKPGIEVDKLKGSLMGSLILMGVLRLGMQVKICPGIVTKDSSGCNPCQPIYLCIPLLHAKSNQLQFTVPGGLINIRTKIDPILCCADHLVGQVLGAVGKLPQIFTGNPPITFPTHSCSYMHTTIFLFRQLFRDMFNQFTL